MVVSPQQPVKFPVSLRLSTETELLDNASVPFDVDLFEIVEGLTSLTYQAKECTLGVVVLLVLFQMLGEVCDTVGKQSNLTLCRAGVNIRLPVFCENLLLFVCG